MHAPCCFLPLPFRGHAGTLKQASLGLELAQYGHYFQLQRAFQGSLIDLGDGMTGAYVGTCLGRRACVFR